ncbi:insulinase family protein [Chlamydia sp. 17-3921]|uniref:insulinase family protein n=1 Tax=Chlamydia sp. 17-3921 TaxID=2675798 RepID=UPI00191B2768|nr:insulinase family protein [Chlamydia sp. 17-3921]
MLKQKSYAFLLCLSLLITSCKQQHQIISDQCPLQILTTAIANQKIAKVICSNGLPLLIVSAPNQPTSGAALLVKTGSNADPVEYPGMAHFTEHCVFLGNKKYPSVSSFSHILSNHNGTRNAFTTPATTTYLFSIERSAFAEAIDQFVHLFIHPLFRQEDLDREKHAVHQEFTAHPQSDGRRIHRIQQLISPIGHPIHRFSCGNISTLSSITSEKMAEWFGKHYSPENMCAIAYTSDPLPKAIKSLSKVFSQIPVLKTYEKQKYFLPSEDISSPKQIFINKAIQPISCLEIYWHLYHPLSEISQGCYAALSRILKHEGTNSLASMLKEKQLITKIDVDLGKSSLNTKDFYIYYELTQKGEENYSQILQYTFQYLQKIQQQKIPSYCAQELSTINALEYSYSSKTELFGLLTEQILELANEDLATYPHRTLIYPEYTQKQEADLLKIIANPEQARYVISIKNPENWTNIKEHYDDIFDMTYYSKSLEKELLLCRTASSEDTMKLPEPNIFLPKDIIIPTSIISSEKTLFPFTPILKHKDDKLTFYYCEDHYYTAPKIATHLRIRTPQISRKEPQTLVNTELYCLALNEKLLELYHPATLAGLSFVSLLGGEGIDLKITGYTATAPILLKSILESISQVSISEAKFDIYKQRLLEDYEKALRACPIRAGLDELFSQTIENVYSHTKKRTLLQNLSFEQFQNFSSRLFEQIYLEVMLLGHLSHSQQQDYIAIFQDFTTTIPAYNAQPFYYQLQKEVPTFIQYNYPLTTNGMLLLLQDTSSPSFQGLVATEMLFEWLHHITFEELRTQQQLGYMVGARYRELASRPFGFFYIRSDAYSPEDLIIKTQEFISNVVQKPEMFGMSPEYFQNLKIAYINKIREPENSFEITNTILFSLAFEKPHEQFSSLNQKIAIAEAMNYKEFLVYSQAFLTEQLGQKIPVYIQGKSAT